MPWRNVFVEHIRLECLIGFHNLDCVCKVKETHSYMVLLASTRAHYPKLQFMLFPYYFQSISVAFSVWKSMPLFNLFFLPLILANFIAPNSTQFASKITFVLKCLLFFIFLCVHCWRCCWLQEEQREPCFCQCNSAAFSLVSQQVSLNSGMSRTRG